MGILQISRVGSPLEEIKSALVTGLIGGGIVLNIDLVLLWRGIRHEAGESQLRHLRINEMKQVRPRITLLVSLARPNVVRIGSAIKFNELVVVSQFLLGDLCLKLGEGILF